MPFDNSKEGVASNWYDQMWGSGRLVHPYAEFIGSLLGLSLLGSPRSERGVASYGHAQAEYAVITFNYDRVLESLCENASQFLGKGGPVAFRSAECTNPASFGGQPLLVKLHGDVKDRQIEIPTWSKGITDKRRPAWQLAYSILRDSTAIRFLGYSLPLGDSYFRYLMKAALADGRHTKEIDVICLDRDGTVRARYEEFVIYRNLRFHSTDLSDYLENVSTSRLAHRMRVEPEKDLYNPYQWLEDAHRNFLSDSPA